MPKPKIVSFEIKIDYCNEAGHYLCVFIRHQLFAKISITPAQAKKIDPECVYITLAQTNDFKRLSGTIIENVSRITDIF